MIDNQLSRDMKVTLSLCDSTAAMSVTHAFDCFMDMAEEHATVLNMSASELKKTSQMWLAVKTILRIHRLPSLGEKVTAITWPERPGHFHSNRDCAVYAGKELLFFGKTEWAILDGTTGKLCRVDQNYPEGFVAREEEICPQPFTRIRDDFTEEIFATRRVMSTDLDLSQHMNNVAYVRAICSLFSAQEWKDLHVREMEVHYKLPCYEGQTLRFQKRMVENSLQFRVSNDEDQTVLFSVIR